MMLFMLYDISLEVFPLVMMISVLISSIINNRNRDTVFEE